MTTPSDNRPPMAIAAEWVSRIMVISLEMVLPGVGGLWLDKQLGTRALFTVAGFGLGMAAAGFHLLKIVNQSSENGPAGGPPRRDRQ